MELHRKIFSLQAATEFGQEHRSYSDKGIHGLFVSLHSVRIIKHFPRGHSWDAQSTQQEGILLTLASVFSSPWLGWSKRWLFTPPCSPVCTRGLLGQRVPTGPLQRKGSHAVNINSVARAVCLFSSARLHSLMSSFAKAHRVAVAETSHIQYLPS